MKRIAVAVLLFAAASLLGPVIRLAGWPPGSTGVEGLIYELVFLLWPTQGLASAEATIGQPAAIAVATLCNMLLFAVIGAGVGAISTNRRRLLLAWLIVGAAVVTLGLVGSGFDVRFMSVAALSIALVGYSLPFLVLRRSVPVAAPEANVGPEM